MGNYLLDCDLQEKIWSKLIQLRACVLLINEVTNPDSENPNDNINSCSWMVSDELDAIITSLENLPLEEDQPTKHNKPQ